MGLFIVCISCFSGMGIQTKTRGGNVASVRLCIYVRMANGSLIRLCRIACKQWRLAAVCDEKMGTLLIHTQAVYVRDWRVREILAFHRYCHGNMEINVYHCFIMETPPHKRAHRCLRLDMNEQSPTLFTRVFTGQTRFV